MKKKDSASEEVKKFEENPYNPEKKKPEDVVRLFYMHNVPIIPVISKRGALIGILKKEDVISELSDIERVETMTIDKFITKVSTIMTFDALLRFGKVREFVVINIFGEEQGRWTRLQLFTATESKEHKATVENDDVEKQKEEQILEWMIYLILEHIPRPLYALNEKNKTIFYNSHFEDLYTDKFADEVDVKFVENSLKNTDKNQLIAGINDDEIYFFNQELNLLYEKVPLLSKEKRVGFLVFCLKEGEDKSDLHHIAADMKGRSLGDMLETVERQIVVDTIHEFDDLGKVAESLQITRKTLNSKIKKYNIEI